MKKLLPLLLFILLFSNGFAQQFGNEWINFSQTYVKIRLVKDGLYRLSYSTMEQFGVPANTINGNTIQIFNKGKEVPVYVTTDGLMGPDDYIEFYGVHNDGEWDSTLYRVHEWQANDRMSLFNDTAYYFLTWGSSPVTSHFANVSNNIINPPAKEPFCYSKSTYVGGGPRTFGYLSQGAPTQIGLTIYTSDFLATEGYIDGWFNKSNRDFLMNTPHAYSSGTAELKLQLVGGLEDEHNLTMSVNGNLLASPVYTGWIVMHFDLEIPDVSWLSSPTSTLSFSSAASPSPNDYNGISWLELRYPREFNFDESNSAIFTLESTGASQYIELSNFFEDGTNPLLYDFDNKLRLEGIVENDTDKWLLPASAYPERNVLVIANNLTAINSVDSLWPVNFVDFSNPGNQGNFIMITHPQLLTDSLGNNNVEQYRQWKQDNGYQAKTVSIEDLYDQFAYGIRYHISAVRKFAQYIVNKWPQDSRYFFLIGKGIEFAWCNNTPYTREQCFVPTFGYPGSDELLTAFGTNLKPLIPVGRISVINGGEVGDYLSKAKEFVNAQNSGPQTIAHSGWMKNVIHLCGGNTVSDQEYFLSYLNSYKALIEDPYYGGKVFTFSKNTTDPVQQATSDELDSLIQTGVSLITFYGHSSVNSFNFNLDKPENYNNNGKYPIILTNGCLVGNPFTYGHGFADDFVLTKDHGAIGFLGPSIFSVASSLDIYSSNFYKNLSVDNFDMPIGDIIAATLQDVSSVTSSPVDFAVAQQMLYSGDPTLKINTFPKPDYVIETQNISFDPPNVSAGLDSFFIQVVVYNLGKAIDDSIYVDIKRTLPDGSEEFLYHKRVKAPYNIDTLRFSVQTEPSKAFGLNYFYIKVDAGEVASANGDIDELDENNNSISNFKLFINADDIVPVWPYDYSIVGEQNVTLKASTVNSFAGAKQYVFQIDTTQNFNSPLLQTKRITQTGGVVKWTPSLTMMDGKVYYWRTSVDTLYNNTFSWHNHSFIYLAGSSPGWNQSHYFQLLSTIQPTGNVVLPDSRHFEFVDDVKTVGFYNGMTWWVGGPLQLDDPAYYMNGVLIGRWDCGGYGTSFLVAVIDSSTGEFWENPWPGDFYSIQCKATPRPYYQFNTYYPEHWGLWDLLDTIPNKDYVLLMSMNDMHMVLPDGTPNWDSAQIAQFTNLGLTKIAQINKVVPYVAFFRKGDPDFPKYEVVGDTFTSIIDTTFSFVGHWDNGYIQSPVIGPAASWTSLHWKAHSVEPGNDDQYKLELIGISDGGVETVLSQNVVANDTLISALDASEYPYLKLKLTCADTIHRTPVQLDYWRVNYQPMPEAALDPSSFFQLTDSINQYLPQTIKVTVENLSQWNMDSMLMKYQITDAKNGLHTFYDREKPLAAFDTIHAQYTFNTDCDCFTGNNSLYIEANPDDDQPEETHFNNFGIIDFDVISDNLNPLLDVTFDGLHIMDGDLVSAKPEIDIMLKDENQFVPLNDTSEFDIYFIYPDGTTHPVVFDNVKAIFYPADSANLARDNTARVTLREEFITDGKYQLVVQGYDRSDNASGDNAYRITFEVINKPMISNVFNYPNPYSTATRFVFTLTGSETPQQMKITIYTVSGKVVREIFLNELGNIHIGNNITQFAYDGTDQFGDKLANGLYFYKVETMLNGKAMDHYDNSTDSYFKKSIGKMYLMR